MIRYAAAFILGFGLCFASWVPIVRAQPPRNYPCAVIEGRVDADCVNGKILALESKLDVAIREAQHAAEAARQARDETAALRRQQARTSEQQIADYLWNTQNAVDWWYFRARAEGVK